MSYLHSAVAEAHQSLNNRTRDNSECLQNAVALKVMSAGPLLAKWTAPRKLALIGVVGYSDGTHPQQSQYQREAKSYPQCTCSYQHTAPNTDANFNIAIVVARPKRDIYLLALSIPTLCASVTSAYNDFFPWRLSARTSTPSVHPCSPTKHPCLHATPCAPHIYKVM